MYLCTIAAVLVLVVFMLLVGNFKLNKRSDSSEYSKSPVYERELSIKNSSPVKQREKYDNGIAEICLEDKSTEVPQYPKEIFKNSSFKRFGMLNNPKKN